MTEPITFERVVLRVELPPSHLPFVEKVVKRANRVKRSVIDAGGMTLDIVKIEVVDA